MVIGTVPRTILVPLSGTEEDRTALRCAAMVARRFQAHIEVVFVTPDARDSVMVLGDGLSTLMVDEIMAATQMLWRGRIEAARRYFDAVVTETGLVAVMLPESSGRATIRWREEEGRIDHQVIAEGRLVDLIVFAHRCAIHSDGLSRQALEAAVLFTGRPVLLAPDEPGPAPGRVVAMAWDGKLEAARAVAAALPFAHGAERIVLLTVGSIGAASVGVVEAARLAESLAWRGLSAEVARLDPEGGAVGAALLRGARSVGADLLVMGAYGHSRVREMILGGATRHILSHAGPAVLLAH